VDTVFVLCWFQSPGLMGDEPWCIGIALLFERQRDYKALASLIVTIPW